MSLLPRIAILSFIRLLLDLRGLLSDNSNHLMMQLIPAGRESGDDMDRWQNLLGDLHRIGSSLSRLVPGIRNYRPAMDVPIRLQFFIEAANELVGKE